MNFGTGLGIALGAGADAYRKQTAFDTDQQYQKMLMADQQNKIDTNNRVQANIQALAPTGATQYQTGTDGAGNPIWSTQAPTQAQPSTPAAAAPAAATTPSALPQASPVAAQVPSMPAAQPAAAGALPQASPVAAAQSFWTPPPSALPTDSSGAPAPQAGLPAAPDATGTPQTAPAVPSRVYTAQMKQQDIANEYLNSGNPTLIAAGAEIQKNVADLQLTQQRIRAGARSEADAALDDNFKRASLIAPVDPQAALNMVASTLPGNLGMSVEFKKADGPAGTENQFVPMVYDKDHQLRYPLAGGTAENLIQRMRANLLDPLQRSELEKNVASAHELTSSAGNLDSQAKERQAEIDAGGPQAKVSLERAQASNANANARYLGTESDRNIFRNNAESVLSNPDSTPAQLTQARTAVKLAAGILPGESVKQETNGDWVATNPLAPAGHENMIFSPEYGDFVPFNTKPFAAANANTPEFKSKQVTYQRKSSDNSPLYIATADGTGFDNFAQAQAYAKGWAQAHPKETRAQAKARADKPKDSATSGVPVAPARGLAAGAAGTGELVGKLPGAVGRAIQAARAAGAAPSDGSNARGLN